MISLVQIAVRRCYAGNTDVLLYAWSGIGMVVIG